MFLTPEEIVDLTDRRNPRHQSRWLAERGYPFEISASGRPKVLRSEIESRLSSTERKKTRKAEPNWEALET